MVGAIWVLGGAAEHLSTTLAGKILASKIQYIGIMSLPPAMFVTVLVASGRAAWIRSYLAIAAPFAAFGVIAAAVFFLPACLKNWHAGATFAYIGFIAPWIANVVYVTRSGPWPELDLTPLALVITGVSFTISFRGAGSVFSTIMLAQRDVLEHIADLILVFDNAGRVLSANRAARETLDLPPLPASAALGAGLLHPASGHRLRDCSWQHRRGRRPRHSGHHAHIRRAFCTDHDVEGTKPWRRAGASRCHEPARNDRAGGSSLSSMNASAPAQSVVTASRRRFAMRSIATNFRSTTNRSGV